MTTATRAAVTGIGVIAPTGLGVDTFWTRTLTGGSALGPLTRLGANPYPVRVAGEVRDYVPADHVPSRLLPQTDRMTRFALTAADWAVRDAGLRPGTLAALDMGVITAASSGGFEFGQRELQHLWGQGPGHVSAYMSFAWFYAVNSGQISIRHDMRGPTGVFVTEQAGGLDAVAHARRKVRQGTPFVLTGGLDAPLSPYGIAAQLATGLLSRGDDPAAAYLPFHPDAAGYVPGEGGAILAVEDAAHARDRGARSYGEIAGYGAAFDPRPGSGRPANLARAIENALADAGLGPADIAVVFADAAAVPELDRAEAEAIAAVFGPHGVPVTAPKTATGRIYAGGAPLDLVTALLALRDGAAPPTPNVTAPAAAHRIDLVTGAPRPLTGHAALVVARGLGGFNSAMVVRAPHDDHPHAPEGRQTP
ncbi:ketosynthase chain-length factor [Marinactinospora rubrisoli]|uniref:Ketosynthase chain-length factor n=1 Tax=Marinactinospora rubrisoli TaxID=2715399 RepID=A0ABW2KPJ8_9ACTN